MNPKFKQLSELGQSLWYDNISRDLLNDGTIQELVDQGILGMTSNPSIFQKAITSGSSYDNQMNELVQQGMNTSEIYEALVIQDIQRAADILRPVYDRTQGGDGYISLEVSPLLAADTAGTIADAARLAQLVNRPNLMIKIPATPEGLPAITKTIAAGINVNVTLIFSRDMYAKVIDAYLTGLERRVEQQQPIDQIASVASFFVSRVDSLVDKKLEVIGGETINNVLGQAAIANAKLAYQLFQDVFGSERFQQLKENSAQFQRPLWASTSTKNPAYRDVRYVEELIGPHTINTAPPHTIEAFKDHGEVSSTLEQGMDEAQSVMDSLADIGIDMDDVTDQLLEQGVESFAASFKQLMDAIEEKRRKLATTP